MKRSSLGTLAVAAFLAFAVTSGGCTPGSAARQQRLAEAVEKFHTLARTDPGSALSRYQTPECAEKFAPTYKAFKDWASVLRPTTYETTFVGPDDALVLFYNPWSDIGLITLWQPVGSSLGITDSELVPGDCIRNRGKPPFSLRRHWLRMDELPVLAVAKSTYQTLVAFQKAFEPASGEALGSPTQWRQRLGGLLNPEIRDAGVLNAAIMLSMTFDDLRKYRLDPKLAPVRKATEATLALLKAGRQDEALRTADRMNAAARKELAVDMTAHWGEMKVVAIADVATMTFVFLDSDAEGGLFASFFFHKQPGGAVLKRIDFMDIDAYCLYEGSRQQGAGR